MTPTVLSVGNDQLFQRGSSLPYLIRLPVKSPVCPDLLGCYLGGWTEWNHPSLGNFSRSLASTSPTPLSILTHGALTGTTAQ